MSDSVKKAGKLALRILVTLMVFWLIFRSVDLKGVMQTMVGADPLMLVFALLFQLLSTIVAGFRWKLVMHRLKFSRDLWFYLRSYFKGSFFNQGLPTSIGGDALRVLDVAGTGHRKRDAFYGVAVDRGLGLAGLLLFNFLALQANERLLPRPAFLTINSLVSLGMVGFAGVYLLHKLHWLERSKLTVIFYRISERLSAVLSNARDWAVHVPVSLFIHLLTLLAIYCLGLSVGMEFGLWTYMVIVPPVILLTIVPVSLAGWGVREGGMIGLFTLIGGDKTQVLSMSILYGITLIVTSLPGLYAYLTHRHAPAVE